ncbi:hypothetical protein EMCRGX_G003429 [Ephydatia muelleri]
MRKICAGTARTRDKTWFTELSMLIPNIVGDKVLKSNARNRHRMGGKLEKTWLGVYIIQTDLGKGRYCLKTLEGKPFKQTIHCARLKRFLDPVVDDNIVDEVEELDNSDNECAGGKEAANGKGMGDSVHHEENDKDKEPGCQNEEQKSHSQSSMK